MTDDIKIPEIIQVPVDMVDAVFKAEEAKQPTRGELHKAAAHFLLTNQECYVAQWILQNPFVDISQYKLKFQYNSEGGYSVSMDKM